MNRNNASFAELPGDRMITDLGPPCPDCGEGREHGMWIYLIPSESDWQIAHRCREGYATVSAQCACCHRVENFDAREPHTENVTRVRLWHNVARRDSEAIKQLKLTGTPYAGIHGVVSGNGATTSKGQLYKVTLWLSVLNARGHRIDHRAKVVINATSEHDACNRAWGIVAMSYETRQPKLSLDARLAPSAELIGDAAIVESSLGVL